MQAAFELFLTARGAPEAGGLHSNNAEVSKLMRLQLGISSAQYRALARLARLPAAPRPVGDDCQPAHIPVPVSPDSTPISPGPTYTHPVSSA